MIWPRPLAYSQVKHSEKIPPLQFLQSRCNRGDSTRIEIGWPTRSSRPFDNKRVGLSAEEPDAVEPARPDLWGAGETDLPGLPDPRELRPRPTHDQNG